VSSSIDTNTIATAYRNATQTTINGIPTTHLPHRLALGDLDTPIMLAFEFPELAGFYDVIVHGMSNGLFAVAVLQGKRRYLTPKQVAQYILAQPDYQGQPIRLLSCYAGQLNGGFAAQLDRALDYAGVLAATGAVDAISCRPEVIDGAIWQFFQNNQISDLDLAME
jgi:hypothetical protein